MSDGIVEWLRKNNIPVTREHYFDAAWLTPDWDWNLPLPAEMEAELPEEVRFPNYDNLTQAELDLIFEGVDEKYMEKYL